MSPIATIPESIPGVKFASSLQRPQVSMAPTARKLGTKRKIICFSDFDGTIFMQDTGFVLFNQFGCGQTKAVALEHQIKTGERSFRDVSEEMWGSLNVTFDDGFEVMKTALEIDPAFREFHTFCQSNDIPFNVISAGLKPVLRGVLDHFIGQEASSNIKIIANDVQISKDGGAWKPVWLHDTPLGHDKARSITEARAQANDMFAVDGTVPLIVFIGDGVSDLPAAREADVLFARRGLRLEEYCIENRIPYIPFDTFADVQRELTKIARRDEEQTRGQGMPADFNPRANMWRRISSGNAIPLLKQRTPKVERVLAWPDALPRLGQESAPVAA